MESSSQDKNLPATERRLQKAREEGQVARSTYLPHLAMMGAGALAIIFLLPRASESLVHQIQQHFTFSAQDIDAGQGVLLRLGDMTMSGLWLWLPIALLVLALGVLSSVALSGFLVSAKLLNPDWSRISPFSGLKRIFSKDKLFEVLLLTVVVLSLTTIVLSYIYFNMIDLSMLALQTGRKSLENASDWLLPGLGFIMLALGALALADIPIRIFLHKSSLKMSVQEVKQEHKESDGSPELKSRRRAMQMEMANRNSLRMVPSADFVVVNPTHYAVALKYDEQTMPAPRVVAKGADMLALKIREMAGNHQIELIESPALARALYAHAPLNAEIPSSLFSAVAQVLAYVYLLRAAKSGGMAKPVAFVPPEVPDGLDPQAGRA